MNKKIYYKDKYIEFTGNQAQISDNQSIEVISEPVLRDSVLKKLISDFLDEKSQKSYVLVGQDFKKVIDKIKPDFHYIEAAGGFIEKLKKYLFIFRHNRWDLPKGKFEKNESTEHCAVRECEEECGVKNLVIKDKLKSTWHIYPHKGSFALKQTYWFYMSTTFEGKLSPQLEEDITEVRWFSRQEIKSIALKNTYYTIADVVNEALEL
jgi:ADP-ribose pyrophosphatase YjhB (NUDIX family)